MSGTNSNTVSIILKFWNFASYILFATNLPEPGREFIITESIKKEIRSNVKNGKIQSLFVGITDRKNTDYFFYGSTTQQKKSIDENTIFEIGSISKVFTSLVLADMVEKSEVNLDDPIDKFLPENVKTPTFDGKKITLLDLATHTSGLQSFPDNFPVKRYEQILYDRKKMYEYLSQVKLSREIGSKYEYSNFGFSLLGLVLSLKARKSFEPLLHQRVLEVLELDSTCIKLCDGLRERFATPHLFGIATDELSLSEDMACAGEIRASGKDLLSFLSYAMNPEDSSLRKSFELIQKVVYQAEEKHFVGLGWHIFQKDSQKIIAHNGATHGFSSFAGFDPESKKGVVILTNSFNPIDDIGFWILKHGPK